MLVNVMSKKRALAATRTLIGVALIVIIVAVVGILLYQQLAGRPTPPTPTPAQATITGQVVDEETGNPVEGATVEVNGHRAVTGLNGSYTLKVGLGTYTLTVSKEGYETKTETVTVTEAKTYTINVSVSPKAPAQVVLKIITRHGADIQLIAEKLFLQSEYAKKYNIVDIRWIPVGPALWADTIRKAGDIDVGWGGGPVLFDVIHREGLLAPLTSDEVKEALKEIPDEIMGAPLKRYDGNGNVVWVASAIASFGITINKQYLNEAGLPAPARWADLANETYAATLPSPSIATADATRSTSNTRMFEIILQIYGWERGWKILTLMAANAKIFDASESVRDAVIMGEVGAGTTIDFYGYTAQLENPEACEYVLPEDGTIVNGDPIALLKTSKHPEAAQAFIAWVISAEGQKAWLNPKINRLPVNPKVFETPEGKERPDLKEIYERTMKAMVISFSDELASSYEYSLMYFFHATLVRAQMKLQAAWMRLTSALFEGKIDQASFQRLVDMLANPLLFNFTDPITGEVKTFTQEYAQSINSKILTDPTFKAQIVDAWVKAAEARYDHVLQELEALGG